jgi:protoporphyrinogen oxidase
VESDGSATDLDVQLEGGETERREYDAIIATTPSYVFTRLASPLPVTYQNKLSGIDYLSAVLMVLVMDRPFTNKYWLNIADLDMPFVALIEHTNLIDRELYGGKHILYISNYPVRGSELYLMSGEELMDLFVPHLQKINPDFDRSWVVEYHHHRVDGAQPIVGVNYGAGIPDHRTPLRGLYLANTTQIYPEDRGTNYSVRMGRQVARMVVDNHEESQ